MGSNPGFAVGVMSYTVSRRTHELAIRMALGADRIVVLRQILREGLAITLIGVIIGIVAALGLSRIMANYVCGIKATDPLTYVAATLVLGLTALTVCYVLWNYRSSFGISRTSSTPCAGTIVE